MSNLYLNNDKINEHKKKGLKYKAIRGVMTGIVVLSLVPTLTGCGDKNQEYVDPGYDQETAITQEYKEHGIELDDDTLYLGPEVTNEALELLEENGENIKSVHLYYALNVDDLSSLAEYCPNIESIDIEYSPSISDLSFIYSLHNLQHVSLEENGFVTPELVEYLDRNGIEHNITTQDLANAEELDRIIDEIITDDMTDEEKIQAITYYVIDNYRYRITKVGESNERPLSSTLENEGGVCASYAYLTNVLMRKAGINSYEVLTENKLLGHAWNLIELDGKYYYLDTTNIKQIPIISKLVLKHFNVGFFYMTDPSATGLSPMIDYDKVEKVSIPEEMIEDIERGESEKNIYEKYGNSVPARIIELAIAIAGISLGFKLTSMGIGAVKDTVTSRKIKRARKKANKRKRNQTSYNRPKNSRPYNYNRSRRRNSYY